MGSTGRNTSMPYTSYDRRADEIQNLLNSGEFIGDRAIEEQVNSYIRYSLPEYGESAVMDSYSIESNPGGGEFGDVDVEYHINYRIPYTQYDSDGYEYTTYETETEYRTETFQLRVRKRR